MIEIFRDDDINWLTNAALFKSVNDLFKKYDKQHWCGVLFEHLFDNYETSHLLCSEGNIRIAWHGWNHKNYGKVSYETCNEDIKKSLNYWDENCQRRYGKKIPVTKAFPPWHSVSSDFARACKDNGIILDARENTPVYCFHYWNCIEDSRLQELEKWLRECE